MSTRVDVYRELLAAQLNASELFGHDTASYVARTTPGIQLGLGKWRWRFIKNGRIMANSDRAYSRRIDALNGSATVLGGRFNQPQWIAEYGGVVTNGVIGYIYRHRAGDELDDWSHTFVVPERDAITVHDLTRGEVSR